MKHSLEAAPENTVASENSPESPAPLTPLKVQSPLTLYRLANETGVLYGSVGKEDIYDVIVAASESQEVIESSQIAIKDFEPFKALGTYSLSINGDDIAIEIVRKS